MRDGVAAELGVEGFARGAGLPWIQAAPDAPYFVDETGAAFTPIGHNDAVSWGEIDGLYRRRDPDALERRLLCLRVMLEYAQVRRRVALAIRRA